MRVDLVGIEKSFQGVPALAGVDLRVQSGKTLVLLGESGCGKSTLLRIVVGLVEPDRGEVRVDGEVLCRQAVPALRRRLGYVIQDGGLFPHLSARDNVLLMARHDGRPAGWMQARLQELAMLVRLEPACLDRFPLELSGGQRQRVGLMRALMLDPDLLLMDEPLGALDPITRSELSKELHAIFGRLGKAVIWVTHDLREAAFFGDEVVILHRGQVAQAGDMETLSSDPATDYVRRFIEAQAPWTHGRN